jgi:hypothetical protein
MSSVEPAALGGDLQAGLTDGRNGLLLMAHEAMSTTIDANQTNRGMGMFGLMLGGAVGYMSRARPDP